jgi:hypothetical protein
MNKNLLTIFLILQSLFQIGCKEDTTIMMLPQNENGNVSLMVSNQSFAINPVDIKIYIDDTLAVNEEFEVGNQHNWKRFRFDISNGEHFIMVKSIKGAAILEQSFSITDSAHWVYVNYWYYTDDQLWGPTEKRFDFNNFTEKPWW